MYYSFDGHLGVGISILIKWFAPKCPLDRTIRWFVGLGHAGKRAETRELRTQEERDRLARGWSTAPCSSTWCSGQNTDTWIPCSLRYLPARWARDPWSHLVATGCPSCGCSKVKQDPKVLGGLLVGGAQGEDCSVGQGGGGGAPEPCSRAEGSQSPASGGMMASVNARMTKPQRESIAQARPLASGWKGLS